MTEGGSERLRSLPKVILLINSDPHGRKLSSSGLPLWGWGGGATFHEREGQTSLSPPLVLRISHYYLLTYQAGFKGAATPWKETVSFFNKNPPKLEKDSVSYRGKARERESCGSSSLLRNTRFRHPPFVVVPLHFYPKAASAFPSFWMSSPVSLSLEPRIPPLRQPSDWPFKHFCLKGS